MSYKVVTDVSHYNAIASRIQVYGSDEKLKPSEMSGAIDGIVHDAELRGEGIGYADGYGKGLSKGEAQGYIKGLTDGEAQGRQEQNEEFWSKYLSVMESGGDAYYLFAGTAWNSKTFYPTKDIVPTGNCHYMFQNFSWYIGPYIDLTQRLKECNVTLDTSQNKGFALFFANCFVYRLPKISFISASGLDRTFMGAKILHTIDELEFRTDGGNVFLDTFKDCGELTTITKISGVIGNSVSFSTCPKLTSATVDNIVGALKQFEPGANAKTLTLHKDLTVSDEQKARITQKGWSLAQ